MKTMKTLLAMVVAVCLVMSLSVPVFASTVETTTAPANAETTTAPANGETTTAPNGEVPEPTHIHEDGSVHAGSEHAEDEVPEPTHIHEDGSVHAGSEHTEDEDATTTVVEEEEAAWRKPVRIVLVVLEVIASIALGAVVLMQSGKEAGLSGALTGNSESYMNKSGKGGLDKMLAKSTKWVALVWLLLTLALCLI